MFKLKKKSISALNEYEHNCIKQKGFKPDIFNYILAAHCYCIVNKKTNGNNDTTFGIRKYHMLLECVLLGNI